MRYSTGLLSKQDVLGIKIFSGVLLFLLLLSVGMFILYTHRSVYDRTTLCPVEQSGHSHYIFIFDTTDSLSEFQADYIYKQVLKIIDRGKTGDRFTAYGIDANKGGLSSKEFDMCKPSDGEGMNPIYENPRLAERRFSEFFQVPFSLYLGKLKQVHPQSRSPLVEALSDLFQLDLFDPAATKRYVYFFSDLLQSSINGSVYHGEKIKKRLQCSHNEEVDSTMVHVLERASTAKNLQTSELIGQWVSVLNKCSREVVFNKVRG